MEIVVTRVRVPGALAFAREHFMALPGAANRQALLAMTEEEVKKTLDEHGFKQGETAYLNQIELSLELKT